MNRTRPGECQRDSAVAEHEVVLDAVVHDEEAVPQVDGDGRDDHHGQACRRGEWRQQAERQKQAGRSLDEPRRQGVATARVEAQGCKTLSRTVRAEPAKPSEQLLRSMRSECQAERDTEEK
jgi:hypothetical protein